MAQAWLIRAGRAGEREQWALKNGVSGGGFFEVADLTPATTREDVAARVADGFPGSADGKLQNFTAQLWALRGRINAGDYVVMPLKNTPHLAIGRVTGDYEYRTESDPPFATCGRSSGWSPTSHAPPSSRTSCTRSAPS